MAEFLGRREFLKVSAAAGALALAAQWALPQSATSQAEVSGTKAAPIDLVRIGIVGVGGRGSSLLRDFMNCHGVEFRAICDVREDAAMAACDAVKQKTGKQPDLYTRGDEDFRRLCDRDDLDVVVNATPWEWHVPISLASLNAGKHSFVEVPAATTVEGCWKLIEAAEKALKHCVMLENCCYGDSELLALNMVRDGVFGELTHGECAYIHDLRDLKLQIGGRSEPWRIKYSEKFNGNIYPTHGLGPVAQYMNINRGDRFDRLVSMSSPSLGLKQRAIEKLGADDPSAKASYILGDMNTTLVKTALGRTIMVQHDTTTPRPYSRINLISGTKGLFAGYPDRITFGHEWADLKPWKEKYMHPLWRKVGEFAAGTGGHGGMDFVMAYRLVDCLHRGLPMDMDVYDAAAWSCLFELTCQSVAEGSAPVVIPDFTKGRWKTTLPLGIVS